MSAIVRATDDDQTFDGRVVDDEGDVYVELRGFHTVSRPDKSVRHRGRRFAALDGPIPHVPFT